MIWFLAAMVEAGQVSTRELLCIIEGTPDFSSSQVVADKSVDWSSCYVVIKINNMRLCFSIGPENEIKTSYIEISPVNHFSSLLSLMLNSIFVLFCT